MELGLKNKVALITGSSRGIGKSIAAAFLVEGAAVIITGRDGESLDNAHQEFSRRFDGAVIRCYQGDLTQPHHIMNCLNYTISQFGKIDILVANIGTGKSRTGFEADRMEWDSILQLNLLSSVDIARAAIPFMKKSGAGCIIFIASIAGCEASPAPVNYSAAKSALIATSKNLARLLAKDNIRVNTIAPGNVLFEGGRWQEIIKEKPNIMEDYIKKFVPMQRFGKPEEIADAVVFLASERASFITGACLVVDGGETHSF